MAIEFASTASSLPNRRSLSTRSIARAASLGDTHKVQNFMWAHHGAKLGGRVWPDGVAIVAGDLSDLRVCGVCERYTGADSDSVRITLVVLGDASAAVNLTVTLYNADTGSTLDTLAVSGASGVVTDTASIARTATTADGTATGDPSVIYGRASGEAGTIYAVAVYVEDTTAAAQVPTGIS